MRPPNGGTDDLNVCDTVNRKAKRKASKSRNDQYCVHNCKLRGDGSGTMIQCHFCQTWVHPECVGEVDAEIVGIWTCKSCRVMPNAVERLLEKMSAIEQLVMKLDSSNQQLVTLVAEQRQEIGALREDVKAGNRQYAEVARTKPRGTTLLVGNSLLRDIHACKTANDNTATVRGTSGATLGEL